MQSVFKIEKYNNIAQGSIDADQELELQLINLDYNNRKDLRIHKLKSMKKKISQYEEKYQRKSQSIIFYILNILIPLLLTITNAYILLLLGVDSEKKGFIIITAISVGFVLAVISNLQIAPWQQIVKLYFLIDSIVPVLIAGIIGFFAVFDYLSTNQWYQQGFTICFPAWVFYYSGSIRVMMKYQNWNKWKLIIYKIVTLFCGLVFFYIGFTYLRGAYKITNGLASGIEQIVKNIILLYVFGNCQLFFSFYRKISDFDQTNDLKYQYILKDMEQDSVQNKMIAEVQYQRLQKEVLRQEIYDKVVTKMKTIKLKKLISDKSNRQQSYKENDQQR